MAVRAENLTINLVPDGNHVGFHAKLSDQVYKEMMANPDVDWSLTFDPGENRAVLKSSAGSYPMSVSELRDKDERFYAFVKDRDAKTLDAIAPVSKKLVVELNNLSRSAMQVIGEKTDIERKKNIQSSRITDEVHRKKGQKESIFKNSQSFRSSIRKVPDPVAPPVPPPEDHTPSPPGNGHHTNGNGNSNGADGAKKEFKFRLPAKRKADASSDVSEQPQKKLRISDEGQYGANGFGFLSKFSELTNQLHFIDPDRDRPPRRLPANNLEQFEHYQHEYEEKYRQYEQLFHALEQNHNDFVELGQLYNAKSAPEKKEIDAVIQEVYGKRNDLLARFRRRYTYLHDELRDIKECLDDYIKAWGLPQ